VAGHDHNARGIHVKKIYKPPRRSRNLMLGLPCTDGTGKIMDIAASLSKRLDRRNNRSE
jgi:hypothetical protein